MAAIITTAHITTITAVIIITTDILTGMDTGIMAEADTGITAADMGITAEAPRCRPSDLITNILGPSLELDATGKLE
jgi:hypothetical protein